MKSNPHQTLVAFVLDKAQNEPVSRRVDLYRGLAIVCGDESEQAKLLAMATALENAELLCREFNFSFIQGNTDTKS